MLNPLRALTLGGLLLFSTLGHAAPAAPEKKPAPVTPTRSSAPRGMVLRTLTDEERDARGRALIDAREREEHERREAIEEAKRRAEREAIEKVERDAAEAIARGVKGVVSVKNEVAVRP